MYLKKPNRVIWGGFGADSVGELDERKSVWSQAGVLSSHTLDIMRPAPDIDSCAKPREDPVLSLNAIFEAQITKSNAQKNSMKTSTTESHDHPDSALLTPSKGGIP